MRALSTTHRRSPWGAGDRPQAPPPAGGPPAEASHGHVLLSLQKSVISIVIPEDRSLVALQRARPASSRADTRALPCRWRPELTNGNV